VLFLNTFRQLSRPRERAEPGSRAVPRGRGTLRYVRAVLGSVPRGVAFRLVLATLAVRRVCRIRQFDDGGVSCRYHHDA
jgi:hypothetical protein